MKKILILLLCLFLLSITKASAQTYKLTLEKQTGIYYARNGGTLPYKSSQFSIYRLGNNIAYCIEPSKNIKTYNYLGTDGYIDLPYDEELKRELELIGYYGREYPNHDNVRYSMAAQALIWEATSGQKVTFWTERYEKGTEIDVTKEKEEILSLVNRHQLLPSLPEEVSTFVKGETVLSDENMVLNNFFVDDAGGNDVTIADNKLIITPKVIGTSTITLKRKSYDDLKTMIFVGEDVDSSQTLGRLRFSDDTNISITIKTEGVRIKLSKVDENGVNIHIPRIMFRIKDLQTNEYLDEIFLTNKEGNFITNPLFYGEYEVEEVENQIISGYVWNPIKKKVSIQYDDVKFDEGESFVEVFFENKEINGILEGIKYGEEYQIVDNEIVYVPQKLKGISFDLYDSENKWIAEITSDDNGEFRYENLKIGKYYLIEKQNNANYVDNGEKYFFEIKQDNQYDEVIRTRITINNYLKKGTLLFTKSDIVTSVGIPNTVIEIYNANGELLFTKKTDDNGEVLLEQLPLGKYYIVEKVPNLMYQRTDEKIFFEIKKNNEIVKTTMVNEKIPVPKTSRNDNTYVAFFCGFWFLIGLQGVLHEKKAF